MPFTYMLFIYTKNTYKNRKRFTQMDIEESVV